VVVGGVFVVDGVCSDDFIYTTKFYEFVPEFRRCIGIFSLGVGGKMQAKNGEFEISLTGTTDGYSLCAPTGKRFDIFHAEIQCRDS